MRFRDRRWKSRPHNIKGSESPQLPRQNRFYRTSSPTTLNHEIHQDHPTPPPHPPNPPLLTLTSAYICTFNPTNPNACPIWIHSTATEARFDLAYAFTVGPSTGEPLLALAQNVNVYFQADGNLAIYTPTTTLFTTALPPQNCSASTCRLSWQTDGNLVIYNNNNIPLWQTGTGGLGKRLTFSSSSYGFAITGAAGPDSAPLYNTAVTGNAPGGVEEACSGSFCRGWMCSGCFECLPAFERKCRS